MFDIGSERFPSVSSAGHIDCWLTQQLVNMTVAQNNATVTSYLATVNIILGCYLKQNVQTKDF